MNGNPPDATGTGMRMRPVGAAIMRPIGVVASSGVGTELSNHEATAFNLQARGVEFQVSTLQPAPILEERVATFRATLPNINSVWEPDISELLHALEKT